MIVNGADISTPKSFFDFGDTLSEIFPMIGDTIKDVSDAILGSAKDDIAKMVPKMGNLKKNSKAATQFGISVSLFEG